MCVFTTTVALEILFLFTCVFLLEIRRTATMDDPDYNRSSSSEFQESDHITEKELSECDREPLHLIG